METAMTDHPETLERYRLPLRRGQLKQVGRAAPMVRAAARNPFLWIGAAAVGVAGVLAWRNRERIAAAAKPVIADARARGGVLIDEATARGKELLHEAKAKGEEMVAKARNVRRGDTPKIPPTEVH